MEKKQNKPRWKLNIFDIIIIAIVIIAAGVLIYIWRFSDKSGNTSVNYKPVHYSIELSGMMSGTAEKIKEGDTILDSTKKFIMGTVVSVSIEPATTPEKNLETGDTVLSVMPDKETAVVELLCNCSSNESQITAESGYMISIGKDVTAAGPGYAGKGYVIAIERGDLEQ
jgi:flagellar basal body-associated protein FliL